MRSGAFNVDQGRTYDLDVCSVFGFFSSSKFYALRSDAHAFSHIENGTVLGEAIKHGCCKMFVLQEITPFFVTELGGNQGCLFFVPLSHEAKEQSSLFLLHGVMAELIDHQYAYVIGNFILDDVIPSRPYLTS